MNRRLQGPPFRIQTPPTKNLTKQIYFDTLTKGNIETELDLGHLAKTNAQTLAYTTQPNKGGTKIKGVIFELGQLRLLFRINQHMGTQGKQGITWKHKDIIEKTQRQVLTSKQTQTIACSAYSCSPGSILLLSYA